MAEYGFKTLEKKYGITVKKDYERYNPVYRKFQQLYKIYSADGCLWEKGLTRTGVKVEIEIWGKNLLEIKKANRR